MRKAPRNPGIDVTRPVPVKPARGTLPFEELQEMQKKERGPVPGSGRPTLLLPLMMNPAGGQATPATPTAPLPGTGPSGGTSAPTATGTGH